MDPHLAIHSNKKLPLQSSTFGLLLENKFLSKHVVIHNQSSSANRQFFPLVFANDAEASPLCTRATWTRKNVVHSKTIHARLYWPNFPNHPRYYYVILANAMQYGPGFCQPQTDTDTCSWGKYVKCNTDVAENEPICCIFSTFLACHKVMT